MDKLSVPLDWSRVQAFLAVVDHGSLSGAARALGASQPTLGRQIKALEAALATKLFTRQAKGLVLNEAGAALVPHARAMQEAAMQMRLVAAGQEQGLAGTVRITASVMVSMIVLPKIIAEIRRAEPEIQIELVPNDASDNLLFREADIAIRMYRPIQLELVARHLGELQLGVYGAKSYLERLSFSSENIGDLLMMDLVGYDREERLIMGLRELGYTVNRSNFATRCDDPSIYWELVRAGCGLGFGPCLAGDADESLVAIFRGAPVPSLPVWLTAHEDMRQTPRVARVWDLIAQGITPLLDPVPGKA